MLNHRSESKNQELDSFPQNIESVNPSRLSAKETTPKAIIGPKIRFKGELIGEEDLIVQGKVEGTIDLKGNTLTVGNQGIVEANVTAKTITIEGSVKGDLHGEERIAITASSNVQGNIKAARVVLEDGAKFRGSIDMDVDSKPASKSSNASSASAPTPGPIN